ncbi:cysteine proteinase [Wilcoxina mikolae CBS 423.85]|nr:cysteine proteinase [Wilcoxina mikolae CBS 423.85]
MPSPPTFSKPQTAKPDIQALLAIPVPFISCGNKILLESTPAIFHQLWSSLNAQPLGKAQTRRPSTNNSQNTPPRSQEPHDFSRTSSDSDSGSSASPSTAPTSPPTSTIQSENESFDKDDVPLLEPTSSESPPKKRKSDDDDSDVKRVKSNDGQALKNEPTKEAADIPKDNPLESLDLKAKPVAAPSDKSLDNPDIKSEVVDKVAPLPESRKSTHSTKRKADTALEEPASQRVKITAEDEPQKIQAKDTKEAPETTTTHTPPKGINGVAKGKDNNRWVQGIRNPNVFCYRNSVLQLLGSCDIFTSEVIKHKNQGQCKIKPCVACCLGLFFSKHFRGADERAGINPIQKALYNMRRVLPDPFDSAISRQEDSYEYLTALLGAVESQLTKNLPDEEKKSHPVYRAFNGCFPSVVQCPKCKHESRTNIESVSLVMEPIASRNATEVISLQSKLNEYFKTEKVEYKCEKCKFSGQCAKKNTMSSPPEFLIINIARHKPSKFAWRRGSKVLNGIAFRENLEMPIIADGVKKGVAKYQLQSVVAHAGMSLTSALSGSLEQGEDL